MSKEAVYVDFDSLVKMKETPHVNIPEIKETGCYKPKDNDDYYLVTCVVKETYRKGCPHCGSLSTVIHGKNAPRLIHDISLGLTQMDLLLDSNRYRCQDCGKTFTHPLNFVKENVQITNRLYEQISRESFIQPFSDLATKYGLSIPTIASIFDSYAAKLEAERGPIIAPKVLGIDEKHIQHKMSAVFVDIDTGKLLEMTENNKKADIINTISSFVDHDKNIEIITTDMANSYRSYIEYMLPNAIIVVDKFHLFQSLNTKITTTKNMIVEYLAEQISKESDEAVRKHKADVRELVVRNPYIFRFGPEKLAEKASRIKILADICRTFPELNHLRLIKEAFELMYEETTEEGAEKKYKMLLSLIPPTGSKQILVWEKKYGLPASLYSEFKSFRTTLNRWHEQIMNYFVTGCTYTNAASEGLNNLIERINREGNGYSFARLRAKALYAGVAAPPAKYILVRKKTPVAGLPTGLSDYVPGRSSFPGKIKYVETLEVFKEEPIYDNQSISVYDFSDENSQE